MTKYKGQTASYAPMLGTLAVALMSSAAVLLTGTGAVAGTCVETFAGSGAWTCSGAANSATDVTQSPAPATGGALTVTTTLGFGIDTIVSGGSALNLLSVSGNTDITFSDVNSAVITGGRYGIRAKNSGTGAISVTATGAVSGKYKDGIYAKNTFSGTALTISAAAVSGGSNGIRAKNNGTGATSVTTSGVVSAKNKDGIYAKNSFFGTDLTIRAATASGGRNGIRARNKGTGAISVTATGAVSGKNKDGIFAYNYATGTDITVSAEAVSGSRNGIRALNYGTGATSITATGTVGGKNKDGIYAFNHATSTDLTVSAAAVSKGQYGIRAKNYGSGATSITATGAVSAKNIDGIYAKSSSSGTTLTIRAAAVSGGQYGIRARNDGSGTTSVTASGAVSGKNKDGIYAVNAATGTDLTVNAVATTGGSSGIRALGRGNGATSVTATGAVSATSATSGDGIMATTSTYGTGLTVSAAAVTGGGDGIYAVNSGSGATSVTATGAVSGAYRGIYAVNSGTSLTISAAAVTGGNVGIVALNFGTGATSVTASGAVAGGAGYNYDGIYALNFGTDLTISAAAVTGGRNGIYAVNNGTGATSVTVTGAVTGGTGYGISTTGGNTTIALDAGAAVSSTAGKGIFNDSGDSTTTVNTGASVAGKIVLGNGSDDLTFAGGTFSGVTLFDGGDDTSAGDGFTDILSFIGFSGALTGATVINWENVVIGAGSTMSFSDNALSAGALTVASGGVLDTSGSNFALTGNLTNRGTVTMLNGAAGDAITVSGNFSGIGNLNVDINTTLDTADTLAIAGNSSGTTQVTVTNQTPGVATGNRITLVTVGGTSAASDFTLAGGPVTYGAFDYDLKYQTGDFVLGKTLNSTGSTYLSVPEILSGFNTLPSMEKRIDGRAQRVGHAGWIRFHGNNSKIALTSGSNTDSDLYGFQVGTDLEFEPGNTGRWVLGVTGQYGTLHSTMTVPLVGSGKIDTTGYGLGFTATWYGNEGSYVDAQTQVNWLDSDLSSSSAGSLVKGHSSTAYALSLEGGHRFDLGPDSAIVPQVQVTWGSVDGGSFTDSVGNSVNLRSNNSTIGRVGVAYEFDRKGAAQKFYVIGNFLHDFSNSSSVTVAGGNMATAVANPTSAEIGFGGTRRFGKMELYGEASVRTALGAGHAGNDRSFGGTLGLRMNF